MGCTWPGGLRGLDDEGHAAADVGICGADGYGAVASETICFGKFKAGIDDEEDGALFDLNVGDG